MRGDVDCIASDHAPHAPADLERRGLIEGQRLHSKTRLTPVEGWPTHGEPVATVLRGRVVVRDGQPVGAPSGRFVRPA